MQTNSYNLSLNDPQLSAVTCKQDGNELTNHRSINLYNAIFPNILVILYSGCGLVVGCSVTEAY